MNAACFEAEQHSAGSPASQTGDPARHSPTTLTREGPLFASTQSNRGEDGAGDQGPWPRQDGQGSRAGGSGGARGSGSLLPIAGRDRRARTRPGAGRVSGGTGRASSRTEGCPARPVGTHLAEHRVPLGPHGCGCRHGQCEGAAARGCVPGCGGFAQPCRATGVLDFHGLLRIESGLPSWEARRRISAAAEVRDKALENAGARRSASPSGALRSPSRSCRIGGGRLSEGSARYPRRLRLPRPRTPHRPAMLNLQGYGPDLPSRP